MPKVTIVYFPNTGKFTVDEMDRIGYDSDSGYEVVMDMKSSHFRNMKRNEDRYRRDQEALHKFFIEAQMSGKQIRER